jgi:CheY-like chemotaxis protein
MLLETVTDVLDLAKIEAGHLELVEAPFALRAVVEEAMQAIRAQAACKQLELGLSLDERLSEHVLGDKLRFRQVLLNLLRNAVKFTEHGGVQLQLRRTAVGVRAEVRDTGIGIAASDLGKLFAPFGQLDRSHNRTFGGSGLGLALCKRLVEAMGGEMGVESEPGRGSLFWFTARLAPAGPQPEKAMLLDPPPPSRSDLRILVVEDNPVNRNVVTLQLAHLGYEAEAVVNGRQAVEAFLQRGHDVILMDCQMPDMNGFEATRLIRGQQQRPQPVIIALTAFAQPEAVASSQEAGMDDFVTKPFQLQHLRATLERWTARKRP